MDIQYLLVLQNFRFYSEGIFNGFFSFITTLGESFIPVLLMAAVYWCFNKKAGTYMCLAEGVGGLVNSVLKISFCVYRPWIRDPGIEPIAGAKTTATGYSFPSGHSTNATCYYGSLALYFRKYRFVVVFLFSVVFLVMLSRNFLGVHTPQDVLVGFGSAFLVILLMGYVLNDYLEKNPEKDIWVMAAILTCGVLIIIYAMTKSYPQNWVDGTLLVDPAKMITDVFGNVGFAFGAAIGWIVERRKIKFSLDGTLYVKIRRYLIGAAVITVLHYILKNVFSLFLDAYAAAFIYNFLVPFFILAIYPALFKKFETKCS